MPKFPRLVAPGYPHHVTQRGIRKQQTFFDDSDYRAYIDLIKRLKVAAGVNIWAYCLMPNHVHLIAVPEAQRSLARLFGTAHHRYAKRVNAIHDWRGHLWQERFYSVVRKRNDEMLDESEVRNIISDWKRFLAEDERSGLIDSLRAQTNTGRPSGDDQFIDVLERKTGRRIRPSKPGPAPKR